MRKIKSILQYIFSIPVVLLGLVVDPFVDGALEDEEEL